VNPAPGTPDWQPGRTVSSRRSLATFREPASTVPAPGTNTYLCGPSGSPTRRGSGPEMLERVGWRAAPDRPIRKSQGHGAASRAPRALIRRPGIFISTSDDAWIHRLKDVALILELRETPPCSSYGTSSPTSKRSATARNPLEAAPDAEPRHLVAPGARASTVVETSGRPGREAPPDGTRVLRRGGTVTDLRDEGRARWRGSVAARRCVLSRTAVLEELFVSRARGKPRLPSGQLMQDLSRACRWRSRLVPSPSAPCRQLPQRGDRGCRRAEHRLAGKPVPRCEVRSPVHTSRWSPGSSRAARTACPSARVSVRC